MPEVTASIAGESKRLNELAETRKNAKTPKSPEIYLGGQTVPEKVRKKPPSIFKRQDDK